MSKIEKVYKNGDKELAAPMSSRRFHRCKTFAEKSLAEILDIGERIRKGEVDGFTVEDVQTKGTQGEP